VAPDRSVFRHPLGPPTDSRRSPHEPRYPTSVPSAGDPAGRGAEGSLAIVLRGVNGFIHELADGHQGCGQGSSVGAPMWTARSRRGSQRVSRPRPGNCAPADQDFAERHP
jgi:hypothetical protein